MADVPNVNIVNASGKGPIIRSDQGVAGGLNRDFLNFQKNNTETFSVDANGLPDPGGGDPKRKVVVQVGDIVADSDAIEHFLVEFPAAVTITNIYVSVDTDSADGSTNKQTISVKQSDGDGEVAGLTTPASNPGLTQAVWLTMGAISNAGQDAAEYLYVDYTKTSSGLAFSGLSFLIEYTLAA